MTILGAQAQVVPAEEGGHARGNATCYVITQIGIEKIRDMQFGNIAAGNSGTIALSPESGFADITGNVALDSKGSFISAAAFSVSDGLRNNKSLRRFFSGYTITLPSSDVLLVNENGKTMRVGNFTSYPSASGYGYFKDGIGQLYVGATLYVTSDQGLGKYVSSAPFPVTVNFY